MKMDSVKNAKRNIVFGVLSMGISVLLPFVSRTVLIYTMGQLYVGLSALFQSVFQLLNMLELGFGVALIYFLYEPIAKDDQERIGAILKYYRTSYIKIGIAILVAGICIMPFISFLIKNQEIPNVNIYVIYFIMLVNATMGYFVFPHARALLMAYQRNDFTHKITIFTEIIKNIIQIIVLLVLKDYYLYIFIIPVCEFGNDVIHAVVAKKKYSYIRVEGVLSKNFKKELNKKISGLFTFKIGSIISNFSDNVVISAFLGLGIEALYANYYCIITVLFSILAIYYSAITAGLGNSIVLESVKSNYKKFQILQFAQEWLIGWISICLLCLFQPFIRFWVGDNWLLPFPVVLLIVATFYTWKIQDIVTVYKEAAGLWDKDKYRPLISAILNLILNLLTVQRWGLYGVVASTLISLLFVDVIWVARSLFKGYFKVGLSAYYFRMLKALFINVLLAGVTYLCCSCVKSGSNLVDLLSCLGICIVIPNSINCLLNFKRWELREVVNNIKVYRKQ